MFSGRHVMHCDEPKLQRQLGSLVNCSRSQGGLPVALVALMDLSTLDVARLLAATVRTLKTIGPFRFSDRLSAFFLGAIPLHEVDIRKSFLKLHLAAYHD